VPQDSALKVKAEQATTVLLRQPSNVVDGTCRSLRVCNPPDKSTKKNKRPGGTKKMKLNEKQDNETMEAILDLVWEVEEFNPNGGLPNPDQGIYCLGCGCDTIDPPVRLFVFCCAGENK
jgi:hypothetical protein